MQQREMASRLPRQLIKQVDTGLAVSLALLQCRWIVVQLPSVLPNTSIIEYALPKLILNL
jgi:hypothetical protein